MLGEAADGNAVHPGFGHCAHRVQRDVARCFEQGAAVGDLHRVAHIGEAEVVEQDHRGTGSQGQVQFVEAFDFDLDEFAAILRVLGDLLGRCHGLRNATGGMDVVFLDQDAVVQPHALVLSATGPHRVFLGDAQAGQGFARIEDGGVGTAHGVDIRARCRRDSRQGLQKVQRRALGGEQGAGMAADFHQHVIGGDGIALADPPVGHAVRVERAETGVEPGPAGDHGRLAGDDPSVRPLAGRYELGGEIAAADILVKSAGDIGVDRVGK